MSNGLLNASGLTTPKVTTEEIILRGKPISDAINGGGEFRITAPHSLGDFYFSITSHMPEGVLPLNGSEVSRVTYSDLYNYVLSIHNELVESGKKFIVSEEEWQNISIENNGYVPYYSYGTGDSLFRLPRMSGYLKATGELDEAGNYVAEGLPNPQLEFLFREDSTGSGVYQDIYGTDGVTVEISDSPGTDEWMQSNNSLSATWRPFDIRINEQIYGNSEHVTPETNTLFVGVWALTAFTQVGTANLSEIKEILSQCETILGDSLPLLSSRYDNKGLETSAWKLSDGSWLDGRIYTDAYNKILQRIAEGDTVCLEMKESELLSTNEFPENFLIDTEGVKFRLPLFVVNERTIIKEWHDGTEWYTIYSDGYCEQGGVRTASTSEGKGWIPLSFHIPFNNVDYNILLQAIEPDDNLSLNAAGLRNKTNTGVLIANANNNAGYSNYGIYWRAEGYTEIPPREEWEIDFNYYFKVSHGVDEGRINIEEKLTEFEETAYTRLNEIVEEVSKDYVVHVDKQVGELYFSFDNYCPDGVIPLDGRLVSRATYADLWEWVQEKGLVKDDALITTNDENTVSIFNEDGTVKYCSWYGSGDGELTFRVPKINGYIKASGDNTSVGQYIAEGLPNITGTADVTQGTSRSYNPTGAFYESTQGDGGNWDTGAARRLHLDASRSSSIYGNSEHVTPETNTIFVGVWAITASKAAVFDMRDIEEALKSSESYLMNNVPLMSSRWDRDGLGNLGWVKADGSWIDGKTYTGAYNYCVEKLVSGHEDFIDGQVAAITTDNCSKFIVDRINKRFRLPITNGQRQLVTAYKEGTQWYNIYSDGWIEQGGEAYNNADALVTVDFLIPYKDTSFIVNKIMGIDGRYTATFSPDYDSTWNYTTSSFTTRTYASAGLNRFRWFAAGYGEVLNVSSPLRTLHLYFKLAHEFYVPAQAEIQEKLDLIDNLVAKTDINLPTLSSRWDNDFAENIGWVKSEGQWLNGNVYRDAYDLMVSRIGVNDKFVEATVGTELTDENADKFLIDTTAVKFRLPLINGERVLVSKGNTNNKTYELYSDGYLIQSGIFNTVATSYISGTITLDRSYKDLYYSIDLRTNYSTAAYVGVYNTKTVSSFKYVGMLSSERYSSWETKGLSAIPTPSEYNCGNYLFFKLADEVPSTVINTEQVVADLKQECDDFKAALEEKFNSGAFVTETFRSDDGKSWYRKWSDGWIEQGGCLRMSGDTNNWQIATLLKPFSNTKYTLCLSPYSSYNNTSSAHSAAASEAMGSRTTQTFTWFYYGTNSNYGIYFYACGY